MFNRISLAAAALLAAPGLFAQSAPRKPAPRKTPAKPAAAPAPVAKPGEKLEEVAVIETDAGTLVVRFFPQAAPNHVANFKELVKSGFYNGTRFHRTIKGFMIQGGDPNTKDLTKKALWGQGDGPRQLAQEFNKIHHGPGILSMARAMDPNSASCQFFVVHGDAGFLDNQYTVFGELVSGMEVVNKIVAAPTEGGPYDRENSRPVNPVAIKTAHLEMRSLPPSAALAQAGYGPPAIPPASSAK